MGRRTTRSSSRRTAPRTASGSLSTTSTLRSSLPTTSVSPLRPTINETAASCAGAAPAGLPPVIAMPPSRSPTVRTRYGVGLVLAGLVHIVTLTVLLAHAVFMLRAFRVSGDLRLLRWIAGAFLAVTAALPLAAKGSAQSSVITWIKADGAAVAGLPERIFGSWQVALVVCAAA